MQFALGCVPSPVDERDYRIATYVAEATVPQSLSYRSMFNPVRDQGSLGSCVAFAGTGIDEFIHVSRDLSEMYAYDQAKKKDGWPGEGTYPRVMLQVMQEGICDESLWPYVAKYPPGTQPKAGAATDAAWYKIGTFARVEQGELKQALLLHGPLMLAFDVYASIEAARYNGIVPAPSGARLGGHAVILVGWDDAMGWWIFRNSWTKEWGNFGYGYIPYDVMPKVFVEAWSVVDDTLIPKRWPDLPDMSVDDLASQDAAWQRKAMNGYPDGTFRPNLPVTQRQVGMVMKNLGLSATNPWEGKWTDVAFRNWVVTNFPQLPFKEDRLDEPLTRLQLLLLVGRMLRKV
jgi:hypothetical protein